MTANHYATFDPRHNLAERVMITLQEREAIVPFGMTIHEIVATSQIDPKSVQRALGWLENGYDDEPIKLQSVEAETRYRLVPGMRDFDFWKWP